MLKKCFVGLVSFVSAALIAVSAEESHEPFNFVFIVDSNYASHCAETIHTIETAMPKANKNAIVIMPKIEPKDNDALKPLADEHTSIILKEINSIDCLNQFYTEEVKKYPTSWSPLILLRCLLASVIDELNKQQDFIDETCNKKPITSFVSLDSDLWILDDLTELFHTLGDKHVFSTPLSPISLDNYEEMILGAGDEVLMGVSSGVLFWNLNEIEDIKKFTASIIDNLDKAYKEHKFLHSDLFCSFAKTFGQLDQRSKSNLQQFLSNIKDLDINRNFTEIIEKLDKFALSNEAEILKNFIKIMKKILNEIPKADNCITSVDSYFGNFLTEIPEEALSAPNLEESYEHERNAFPADESALEPFADTTLPLRFNFNPKDLFPRLSTGNETQAGFPKFSEIHEQLIKFGSIMDRIRKEAANVRILHFDGTIKPWDIEKLIIAQESDPEISVIREFYDKVQKKKLTHDDLTAFKEFLGNRAQAFMTKIARG